MQRHTISIIETRDELQSFFDINLCFHYSDFQAKVESAQDAVRCIDTENELLKLDGRLQLAKVLV